MMDAEQNISAFQPRLPWCTILNCHKWVQPFQITPPLRILGLTASPSGLDALDPDNEKQRMEYALKDLIADGQVQIDWLEHANRRELQHAMRAAPSIFYFAYRTRRF